MGHELHEEMRVARREDPLSHDERRLGALDMEGVLGTLRAYSAVPEALDALRRMLGEDPCAAVHQLSDAGVLREIAARVQAGELELRRRAYTIPDGFPRWSPSA